VASKPAICSYRHFSSMTVTRKASFMSLVTERTQQEARKRMCACLFTALHLCRAVLVMSETSVCLFVCPSVCLSVIRVNCDKTKKICADILIPDERSFILVFWRLMVCEGRPLLSEIVGQTDPVGAKTSIFGRRRNIYQKKFN